MMLNLMPLFFGSTVFIPHGHCYLWQPELVGLHILSDGLIALAYYSIPLTLFYVTRKRQDLPFTWVFLLFSAFIVACGTTHLMEIWTLWHPTYWLSGVLKFITAVISLTTAVMLVQIVPQALALPNPAQLETANQALQDEIAMRKQSELSLSRLAAIVESSDDAIIGKALDGTITSWNAGAEKLFGYTAAEVIGCPIAILFPPNHADELSQVLKQIERGEIIESYETVRMRNDGQYINIAATISPIKDVTGQVIGAAKIARNITARKRAEVELIESEARFQAFMDNSPAAAWITDENGQMLYLSQTYLRLFQVPSDAIGKTIFDLFAPEIAASFHRNIQQVMETNQTVEAIEVAPRPDGTMGEFLVYKFPICELSGQCFVGGIAVDVTEREQVKQQLRSLNDRLQYLLTNAPVVIFSCKPEGDYGATSISENVRTILGYESQAFLEESDFWANHIHPEDRDRVFANVAQIFVDGHYAHEYRFLHRDGEYRWVYNQLQLMRDQTGQPTEIIGYLVDISGRKQAEIAAQKSEARYQAIVQDQTELIVRFQPDGTLTFVNDAYCRYFGMAQENLVGHRYEPVIFADDHDRVDQLVRSINQDNPIVMIENRIIVGDEVRWTQWMNHALFDPQGCLVEIQAVGRDINDLKQVEETLARREEQLRLTLEFTHIGTWDWDIQTGNVSWNDNHFRLLGLEADETSDLYQRWRNATHPDDVERVEQMLSNALTQHTDYETEYRVVHPDGTIHWLVGRGRGMYTKADEPVRMLGIIIDVSDRKHTEEALRRYERIVSATADAILLIDHNYIYQVVNQAYLNWYDKRQDEVLGHAVSDIISQATFQAVIKPQLDHCLAGQASQYERWVPSPTLGSQFLSITCNPYVDSNQTISGVVVSLRDITRLKQAEVELQIQGIMVRNMAEGVCMVKVSDGTFVYANPKFERMFGYDPDELIGQHVAIVNYEDRSTNTTALYQTLAKTILDQGEAIYEVHNVKKDGTSFWCQATTSVFEHPDYGTVFVVVQQDITERKQAERLIQASLQEKEVLLKEIHHRVKNNLGVVDGLLHMQSRRSSNPEVVETLKESQNRIASIALVHEKLYGSQDLAKINFAQYIADLTAHLFDSYNIHASQIKLTTHIDPVSLDIDTAIPCGLIINELVSNALKYAFPTQQTGNIQVTLHQAQDHCLCLTVRDNGVGVPRDFNLKQTKTLGMNLVKGLVKQLKGTLEIDRELGTIVRVTFATGNEQK